MTPAARIQAAIDILDLWLDGNDGMDRILTAWGRRNRYAGSGDRRAIGDLVHQTLRRKRSAAWRAGADDAEDGRLILHGLLLLQSEDPDTMFTGEGHAPSELTTFERSKRRPLGEAPRAVMLDYPDWLEEDFAKIDDGILEELRHRAPLDLRVNLLKTNPDQAMKVLAEDGVHTCPGPLSPIALRVVEGQRKVQTSRALRDGLVEIQDAASQAICSLAEAQAGETILDLCAGGGGKTLALAAVTGNRGRLLAYDIEHARMSDLPMRAHRAGADIEIIEPAALDGWQGQCDLVVVDAPCSGSGTWRRNPDAKWRLTPVRLKELCALQIGLLDQAAAFCSPSGRILYATCSLFERENRTQVRDWLKRHADWELAAERCLTPLDGGDGLYGAVLVKIQNLLTS